VLNCITLGANIFPSHVENHGGTATVLNSSIASELNEIGVAEESCNVIASFFDFLDLPDSEV